MLLTCYLLALASLAKNAEVQNQLMSCFAQSMQMFAAALGNPRNATFQLQQPMVPMSFGAPQHQPQTAMAPHPQPPQQTAPAPPPPQPPQDMEVEEQEAGFAAMDVETRMSSVRGSSPALAEVAEMDVAAVQQVQQAAPAQAPVRRHSKRARKKRSRLIAQ